jgi:hypothetical protein
MESRASKSWGHFGSAEEEADGLAACSLHVFSACSSLRRAIRLQQTMLEVSANESAKRKPELQVQEKAVDPAQAGHGFCLGKEKCQWQTQTT